jgi:hypothetical protein
MIQANRKTAGASGADVEYGTFPKTRGAAVLGKPPLDRFFESFS